MKIDALLNIVVSYHGGILPSNICMTKSIDMNKRQTVQHLPAWNKVQDEIFRVYKREEEVYTDKWYTLSKAVE